MSTVAMTWGLAPRPRFQVPFLLAFAAAAVGAGIGRAVTTSYLPVLLERIDDEPGLIGMVMLVNAGAGFAIPLVVGVWSDRRGRRMPFVIGGAAVSAFGLVAVTLGHGTSYLVLALAGGAVYVGLNAITTAHRALVPEAFGAEERARATSSQELGLLAGSMVGLAAGGALTAVAVWAPFALAALLLPLLALPTVARTPESRSPGAAPETSGRPLAYYRDATRRPGVLAFLVAQILWVLGYAALPAFFLLYAQKVLGLTPARASLILVAFGLTTAAAIALGGRSRNPQHHKALLLAAVALMGTGFLVVAATTSLLVVGVGLVAAATGFGLISTIGFPLFATLIPEGESGGYTAMYFSVRSIASAVALPAAGWLIAVTGSYRAMFVLGGLATLTALLPLLGVRSRRTSVAVRGLAAVVGLFAATLAIGGAVEASALGRLDQRVFEFVNGLGPAPNLVYDLLDPDIRNYAILILLAAVLAALSGYGVRRAAALVTSAIVVTVAVIEAVYVLYERDRPEEVLGATEIILEGHSWAAYHSFPSGHVAVTAALAGSIALAFPRLRFALWAWIGAVAFTRVLFGAHFPVDSLVGLALGLSIARLTVVSLDRVWPTSNPDLVAAPLARRLERREIAAVMPSLDDPPERTLIDETLQHVGRLVIVDDGSSAEQARRIAQVAAETGVELVRLPENAGKGSAVRAGLDALLAHDPPTAVLLIDADGQHPPASIPALLAAAEDAELVIGDRFSDLGAMPRHRRLMNRLASGILALTTGREVRDSQSGMRVLRGRALVANPFPAGRYDAETRHLKRLLTLGVPVAWVPIPALYGSERSSFRALRDTLSVLRALLGGVGPTRRRAGRSSLPMPLPRAHQGESALPSTPVMPQRERREQRAAA